MHHLDNFVKDIYKWPWLIIQAEMYLNNLSNNHKIVTLLSWWEAPPFKHRHECYLKIAWLEMRFQDSSWAWWEVVLYFLEEGLNNVMVTTLFMIFSVRILNSTFPTNLLGIMHVPSSSSKIDKLSLSLDWHVHWYVQLGSLCE
jgi:hypothetical protein